MGAHGFEIGRRIGVPQRFDPRLLPRLHDRDHGKIRGQQHQCGERRLHGDG